MMFIHFCVQSASALGHSAPASLRSAHRRRAIIVVLAGLLLTLGLAAPTIAAAAPSVYWVGDYSGTAQRVWSAPVATPLVPTAITPDTSVGHTYRPLATDGSHLYFVDDSSSKLVRTNLDGSGRIVITAVSGLEAITYADGYVYWVAYSGGVWRALATAGATATQLVTPGSTTGAPGGSGYATIAVTGSTIYFGIYLGNSADTNQGIYRGTVSGGTVASVSKNPDWSGYYSFQGSNLATDGISLYLSGGGGVRKTALANWDQALSTWSLLDTSTVSSTTRGLALYDSMIYFTNGAGGVFRMSDTGGSPTQLYAMGGTTSYGIAVATPTYTLTYSGNGNTGGTAPVDPSSPYTAGSTVTVLGNTGSLERSGYQFLYWDTTSLGTGTLRLPGSTFTINADTVLHAQWTGGPLEFSTALSPWMPVSSLTLPSTTQGTPSSQTVYIANTATAGSFFINMISTGSPAVNSSGCQSTNLAPGGTCAVTLTWTPSSSSPLNATMTITQVSTTYSLSLSGTVNQAARMPTFATPVRTADGFTVNVTNWNASWAWSPSVASGSVSAGTPSGSTLPLTVTGVSPGASATVSVTTMRSGYLNGTDSVSGTALDAARIPKFDTPVGTADGFTVNVTNWDGSWGWVPSVSSGSVQTGTPSGSTLPLTVTGLAASASSTVAVVTTRAEHTDGTGSVLGTAAPAPAPADTGGSGSSSGDTTPVPTVLLRPHQPLPIQRDGTVQLTLVCASAKACFISGTIVATSATASARPVVLARFTRIRVPARSRRAIAVRLDAQRLLIVRVSKRGTITATVMVRDGKGGTRRVPVRLLLPRPESVTG
jgi:hypothetical protein